MVQLVLQETQIELLNGMFHNVQGPLNCRRHNAHCSHFRLG